MLKAVQIEVEIPTVHCPYCRTAKLYDTYPTASGGLGFQRVQICDSCYKSFYMDVISVASASIEYLREVTFKMCEVAKTEQKEMPKGTTVH